MTSLEVSAAYAGRATEYIDRLGSVDAMAEPDRSRIARWAGGLTGPVVDAGCGPGHWTDFLARHGCDAEGVDITRPFLEHARSRYPALSFREAPLEALGVPDEGLGGVLAWYSVIHTRPERLDAVLRELARALEPDGSLQQGFFAGPRVESFEHAVTTAWTWPVEEMGTRLEKAGFEVEEVEQRTADGHRPHAAVVARRV